MNPEGGSQEKLSADYLAELLKDKKQLQAVPNVFTHVERLLDEEIRKVRVSLFNLEKKPLQLPAPAGPKVTLQEKIYVPVRDHPEFNFVGRILGPRGITNQQLEKDTECKIMVRGKGSMRDKKKEESMRGKTNWEHLNEELHVLIVAEDTQNRAQLKLDRAIEEVNKLLVPAPDGEDDLKKRQLMELAIINGTYRDTKSSCSGSGGGAASRSAANSASSAAAAASLAAAAAAASPAQTSPTGAQGPAAAQAAAVAAAQAASQLQRFVGPPVAIQPQLSFNPLAAAGLMRAGGTPTAPAAAAHYYLAPRLSMPTAAAFMPNGAGTPTPAPPLVSPAGHDPASAAAQAGLLYAPAVSGAAGNPAATAAALNMPDYSQYAQLTNPALFEYTNLDPTQVGPARKVRRHPSVAAAAAAANASHPYQRI